jgi:hypothetical protein
MNMYSEGIFTIYFVQLIYIRPQLPDAWTRPCGCSSNTFGMWRTGSRRENRQVIRTRNFLTKHHLSKNKLALKHSHLRLVSNPSISGINSHSNRGKLCRYVHLHLGVIPDHPSSRLPSCRCLCLRAIASNVNILTVSIAFGIFISL